MADTFARMGIRHFATTRHHRRERRRFGGFVAFSEMLADLTPKPLFDKTSSWEANLNRRERAPKPTT
jgi:hypothetical protein